MVDVETLETPLGGLLARLAWMFGCGFLLLLLVPIAMNDSARLSLVSLGFWVGVCIVVAARYLDAFYYADLSGDGAKAALGDAHRFGAGVVVIAGAAWLIVHAV